MHQTYVFLEDYLSLYFNIDLYCMRVTGYDTRKYSSIYINVFVLYISLQVQYEWTFLYAYYKRMFYQVEPLELIPL